ncbi:MAG: outer membrane protein assembly factor BamD [Oleiphilaceae bacterium]|jgi:outer membrane protein assembly factor BamD
MRLINIFSVLIIVCISLGGCSSAPKKESSEQELYDDAKKAIKLRNFSQATTALEELEASFPFGKYAEQAQLDLIYARYSGLDLEGAILACDRFIRLHPQSPSVDYAYYTRGIANYGLDVGISSQYFTMVDNSSRDPGHMRLAFRDFSELLIRFPRSAYASDAQQRMFQVRNNLAKYELHAARYYIKREAFIAAANRAAHVVKDFPNTPALEDALIMMVELYDALDLPSQKEDALAVLKANYLQGKAFDEEQNFVPQNKLKQSRSLTSVISFGLFD